MLHYISTNVVENGIEVDEYEDDFLELSLFRSSNLFIGFQLSYDRLGRHRILTWCPHNGYHHYEVTFPGENSNVKGEVLLECHAFPKDLLLNYFDETSLSLPPTLRQDIRNRIKNFQWETKETPAPALHPVSATDPTTRIPLLRQGELEVSPSWQE